MGRTSSTQSLLEIGGHTVTGDEKQLENVAIIAMYWPPDAIA